MSSPARSSRWSKISSHVVAMIATAILAAIGTYYATKFANIAAWENDGATRYIDFQLAKEHNITSFFRIPGVSLTFKDGGGASVKTLSLVKIELLNFGPRDVGDVDFQIDVLPINGVAPVLQTYRIGNGAVEDLDAKKSVKVKMVGETTSISFQLKNVNRTEAFTPARTILLYFNGSVAPETVVATNAVGVATRPFEPKHYFDAQRARQSFVGSYKDGIIYGVLIGLCLLCSAWLIISGRKREYKNLSSCISVVEEVIRTLPGQSMTPEQQSDAARHVVFSIWKEVYARAPVFIRWLSVAPDRSRL